MATLITCTPASYRTIVPPLGAYVFTTADIVGLLDGPIRVITLRRLTHADEVLLVRHDSGGLPVNTIASAMIDESTATVRGDAVHCMSVGDGEDEFI